MPAMPVLRSSVIRYLRDAAITANRLGQRCSTLEGVELAKVLSTIFEVDPEWIQARSTVFVEARLSRILPTSV